jgi:hypothetical protein
MTRRPTFGLAGFLPLLLTACMQTPSAGEAAGAQPAAPAREVAAAPLSLAEQIEFARSDLAGRLGVEPDAVTVSGARPVNWRSGALGCPEPGMSYTQALVPGALIFLRAAGEVHGYHASQGGKPFLCPRERAEQPVFGRGADMT